jgi:hypothetical protein
VQAACAEWRESLEERGRHVDACALATDAAVGNRRQLRHTVICDAMSCGKIYSDMSTYR